MTPFRFSSRAIKWLAGQGVKKARIAAQLGDVLPAVRRNDVEELFGAAAGPAGNLFVGAAVFFILVPDAARPWKEILSAFGGLQLFYCLAGVVGHDGRAIIKASMGLASIRRSKDS